MITRVIISGYRCVKHLDFVPHAMTNLVVGANEAGKSTLLEAIALGLTGRINGRWASEELNPFWFHRPSALAYFAQLGAAQVALPEISIELYLSPHVDVLQQLRGVHNSQKLDAPGVALRVAPSPDYRHELAAYLAGGPPALVPVEYYAAEWRDFADQPLVRRPKELATSIIDSRTIRSTSGVDYHTREMLSEHLDEKERAEISLAHRASRQQLTQTTLKAVNTRLAKDNAGLHSSPIGLQMDQSARSGWEGGVVPQVDEIPFAMAGQGQQAMIKVALAMSRTAHATFVLIEEPENHLSHTSLQRLIARIETLAGDSQQVFIGTHSSFVLNRIGIDKLVLLNDGQATKLSGLTDPTVGYFRKLSGYDTLRLILAEAVVLVEGPSDAIVFERAFRDATGVAPGERGIDVISMSGLTFQRAFELCAQLDRQAIGLQDNDGRTEDEVRAPVTPYLKASERVLYVGGADGGDTLEPQLRTVNSDELLREVLGLAATTDVASWMKNHKTEGALRILDSDQSLRYPTYITDAIAELK
jgi:putative ATP-dependent endonuclease of the OLD family